MMKNLTTVILIFIGLLISVFSHGSITSESENSKEILLEKDKGEAITPRSTSQALFVGHYNQEILVVTAENYTGILQIELEGNNEQLSVSIMVTESGSATLDIGALPAGSYRLALLTNRGTYLGEFEL